MFAIDRYEIIAYVLSDHDISRTIPEFRRYSINFDRVCQDLLAHYLAIFVSEIDHIVYVLSVDRRREVKAWVRGDLVMVSPVLGSPSMPAWWDGTPRPLDRLPLGLGHFQDDEFLLVIAEDIRIWPGSPTFVGVDCIWQDKKIWFLVDTDADRDLTKRPFGYELTKMA